MSAADRIAAAYARRQTLKDSEAKAFEEQQASDIEALVTLEEEHGFERVLRIDLKGWTPGKGAATMVIARVPFAREALFKRFEETVSKPKADNLKAGHVLATSCIIYPNRKDDDTEFYSATVDLAPGILSHVAAQIVQAVQGQAEEEKKG